MSLLKILTYPNPILRKKCRAIKTVDARIKKLSIDMIETMHAAPGVGLAAPQIGENIQLIVIDIKEGAFALINPKIKRKGKEKQIFEEGCLCLPGISAPVERFADIEVEALDTNGQKITIEASGFLATVLQHEIDHLSGIIFLDKVKDKSLIKETSIQEERDNNELL